MPKLQNWVLFILVFGGSAGTLYGQELDAHITVNSSQVNSQVDKKVFQTLQGALNTFLNSRKWTDQNFETNERITCNFLLTLQQTDQADVYKAALTVQAARPVYNSAYQSPLINYRDDAFTFKYVEYQPIEFNENRVSGSDALVSNLSATFAYYAYLIIGLDFDSFSLRGGDPYYRKAQGIVNNAPDSRDIQGWKAFDGQRNRYWLIDNLTDNKYTLIHDVYYNYFRLGLDHMLDKEAEARSAIMNSVNLLNTLNNDMPNSMIIPFFFQGRSQEIIHLFQKADQDSRDRAREILSRIDIGNANAYKQQLK